jgi:hypothetical protein
VATHSSKRSVTAKLASILKSFGDAQENGSYGSRMFFIDDDERAEWKSLRRAETPGALFAQFSLYLTEQENFLTSSFQGTV